ncbi:hypothetical protein SAMN02787118_115213 [Streptomyces mirabilis]|jgi:hypothetical protein|uniref:Uncharacterized protein n=1 Tax=Streptomyces mirabilis TaxID=68239 RepID=A0A1I2NZP4_9ACTN|nr:hypothetical protein SAMN02787118_115213 [Streptomyces mirabilis]
MADLGVTVTCVAGQVVEEAARPADRVTVPVEPPGSEVVGAGVHPDHTVREGRFQRNRRGGRVLPAGGQVPAAPRDIQVDTVGDGPVGLHSVGPLRTPVREGDSGSEDVPTVPGVGEFRQRGRKLDTDLTVRGDADGLVPVSLPGFPVSGEEPALRLPPLPPLCLGEPGLGQVVPGTRQPFAASHRVNPSGLPVLNGRRVPVLQHCQPTRLRMPLPRGPVAARSMPGSPLTHGQRQAMPDRPDPGLQAVNVRHAATPRQRPLIVAGLGDRPGPPGRRQRRQLPLPRRPRVRGMLQAVRAPRLEIPRGEHAKVRANQSQHSLVLGREVSQPVTHRHTRRARSDKRLSRYPQSRNRPLPAPAHHTHPRTAF